MRFFICILIVLLFADPTSAQIMTEAEITAVALKQNPSIRAAAAETSRYTILKRTSIDLPKAEATLLYGQFNSIEKDDNNLTITQNIPFPTVFTQQRKLNHELIVASQLHETITKNELVLQLRRVFNRLFYYKARHKVLREQDSLTKEITKVATTTQQSLLAKTSAETQRFELAHALNTNREDIQIALRELQLLSQAKFADVSGTFQPLSLAETTLSTAKNPLVIFEAQHVKISERQQKLESAKMLPDIKIGYTNQTLVGTQNVNGQDRYFGPGYRFRGFHAGLFIPLWFGPYHARVKAAAAAKDAAQIRQEIHELEISRQQSVILQQLAKHKNSLNYYQETGLKNSDLLIQQSEAALKNGEQDFAIMLDGVDQAVTLREKYLETLYQYNENVITLEYLNGTRTE